MASLAVSNVSLRGIVCALPEQVQTLDDLEAVFSDDLVKVAQNTGVYRRHITSSQTTTADLLHAAAERLLDSLQWSIDSVDALIVVTQTPDYVLPATSCTLHGRLGLEKSTIAFDINLGCSGYIYGLWIATQLLSSGALKRCLLLVGDTISKLASPEDRSVAPLFGDAGTATALEHDIDASVMHFVLGTDGRGEKNLIVPSGAFRLRPTASSAIRTERENGNIRSDQDLFMNGTEIFTFTLREVPSLIEQILHSAEWQRDEVDAYVMHQANRFMLEYLVKRMKLPKEKVPLALENYGNTSSASIPLTIADQLCEKLKHQSLKLVLAGFGVGYSWGAASLTCGPIAVTDVVLV